MTGSKPLTDKTFSELRDRIKAARRGAYVELRDRVAISADGLDDRATADALVSALGLRALGDQWVGLEPAQGFQVAHEILWRDLAYHSEVMDNVRAHEFARDFLRYFSDHARFLTNFLCWTIEFEVFRNASYDTLTDATFDAGIVVVDGSKIGFLWVEDED